MKIYFSFFCFLLSICVSAQTVVVEGEGIDFDSAVYSALRQAVEQVGGVQITSSSMTRDFVLVKDVILAEAKGYVTNYEVLQRNQDQLGVHYVTVRATVDPSNIPNQRQEIHGLLLQKGNPRFLLDITETIYDGENNSLGDQRIVEGKLRQILSDERGIQVKSARDLTENHRRALLQAQQSNDHARLAQLSTELGFDILIRGNAKANLTFSKKVYGRQRLDYVASITGDAIRIGDSSYTGSAEVLKKQIGQGMGHMEVSQLLLRNAGVDFADQLLGRMLRHWISEVNVSKFITLTCLRVDFGDLQMIEESLGTTQGIHSVQQKSFDANVATYQIQFRGKTTQLARDLHQMRLGSGRLLKIQTVTAETITARGEP
jgi:hypothetical protein